ncbi:hypothetical protein B0H17DRAFT_1034812 [Mycena rosella]|uniref:Uncharacterized protein n=1 Tax=Mycena rosella TaxID=1033263 RepID=A0AAD7GWP6_MYCRO|nr:hypothetical protein B0H17DRAFT_1034812 [Mycena rosella]
MYAALQGAPAHADAPRARASAARGTRGSFLSTGPTPRGADIARAAAPSRFANTPRFAKTPRFANAPVQPPAPTLTDAPAQSMTANERAKNKETLDMLKQMLVPKSTGKVGDGEL